MRTIFDRATQNEVLNRISCLNPDATRRWGRMRAPEMIAHLSDQMRHALGDAVCEPRPGPLRNALGRYLVIYWLPWPKGRVKGPPEAFLTKPASWETDVRTLVDLVNRFVSHGPEGKWPKHALLGRMSGKDWGVFVHKHFDHHLRQFGV